MPISFTIYKQHRVFVSLYSGHVSDEEFVKAYAEIYRNPAVRPGFNELVDSRRAEKLDLSGDRLREVAEMVKVFHGDRIGSVRCAHIVESEYQFAISRVYGTYAQLQGSETTGHFFDLAEALAWLDLPETALDEAPGED